MSSRMEQGPWREPGREDYKEDNGIEFIESWISWAKHEISQGLEKISDLSRSQRIVEAERDRVKEQLEATEVVLERHKERAVHAFGIGTRVLIVEPKITAQVQEVRLTSGGVWYVVAWWSMLGKRRSAFLSAAEVVEQDAGDNLPER